MRTWKYIYQIEQNVHVGSYARQNCTATIFVDKFESNGDFTRSYNQ